MGWALWLQYGLGLEPCPLCAFQRIAVSVVGVIFLVAFIHNPRNLGAAIYAGLVLIVAGGGGALAARHVWLQSLPKDQVPACGMGLSYMMESLPFLDVLEEGLRGQRRMCGNGLGIPGARHSRLDVRVFHRGDHRRASH